MVDACHRLSHESSAVNSSSVLPMSGLPGLSFMCVLSILKIKDYEANLQFILNQITLYAGFIGFVTWNIM